MTRVQESSAEVAAAAYRLTTDGQIIQPTAWQAHLYDSLSMPQGDAAELLLTETGAGKTEAIVIPSLGLHRGGAPRRLFMIAPDGATLDDWIIRLVPYMKAWVMADETPRTVCLDTTEDAEDENQCRRFFPDGSEDPHLITNPLEADVDLILTTYTRFQSLFFGAGGVHALPSALPREGTDQAQRRDLFYFDEAHSYQSDSFARFHRLVEFLYAEDADVIVASTTMPVQYQEELSFLNPSSLFEEAVSPDRPHKADLSFVPSDNPDEEIEAQCRRAAHPLARVIAVVNTPEAADSLFRRLASSHPHLALYHQQLAATPRRRCYTQLLERQVAGQGYLLVTTGEALETSDLDATVVITALCMPENLIRRVGRCNRRGKLSHGHVIVVGNDFPPEARLLPQEAAYRSALAAATNTAAFHADYWTAFIPPSAG